MWIAEAIDQGGSRPSASACVPIGSTPAKPLVEPVAAIRVAPDAGGGSRGRPERGAVTAAACTHGTEARDTGGVEASA